MCHTHPANDTINNKYYYKSKEYFISEILWEIFYDRGVIYTNIHKSKYYMFPAVLKSRLREIILEKCTI